METPWLRLSECQNIQDKIKNFCVFKKVVCRVGGGVVQQGLAESSLR